MELARQFKVNPPHLFAEPMASDRSKAIWEVSDTLSEYLAKQVSERLTQSLSLTAGLGLRLLDAALRLGGAYVLPGNVIEQVAKDVGRGKLVATGYRENPSASDFPVMIAGASFAKGRVKPIDNSLIGQDFRYRNIRLIAKADIPKELRSPRPNQSARQTQIATVIRKLHKDGLLPRLRKRQIPDVRVALEQAGIDNVGTDKTIERLIRFALKSTKRK